MQHLNTLWKMASAASDIAQQTKTHIFPVRPTTTVYLRAEYVAVHIHRWPRSQVEITQRLQMPFGWRVLVEQDEAGVYLVAKRRAVIGGLSNAVFELFIPQQAYVMLKLEKSRLLLENVNGTLHLSPPQDGQHTLALPGNL